MTDEKKEEKTGAVPNEEGRTGGRRFVGLLTRPDDWDENTSIWDVVIKEVFGGCKGWRCPHCNTFFKSTNATKATIHIAGQKCGTQTISLGQMVPLWLRDFFKEVISEKT